MMSKAATKEGIFTTKCTKDTLRRQGYAGQAKEEGRCCETGVSLTLVIFVHLVVKNLL